MTTAVDATRRRPLSIRLKRAARALSSKGPDRRAKILAKAGVIAAADANEAAHRLKRASFERDSKHDRTARRIAQRQGVSYSRGKGPDVNSPQRAIEVETANTVSDGLRQLRGFRKPVYIAGADQAATAAAVRAAKGTTVGVMNAQGKIIKRSSRKISSD